MASQNPLRSAEGGRSPAPDRRPPGVTAGYTHPVGFSSPATLHAPFAGPLGNSV